jgi:hypothetical protein
MSVCVLYVLFMCFCLVLLLHLLSLLLSLFPIKYINVIFLSSNFFFTLVHFPYGLSLHTEVVYSFRKYTIFFVCLISIFGLFSAFECGRFFAFFATSTTTRSVAAEKRIEMEWHRENYEKRKEKPLCWHYRQHERIMMEIKS